MKPESNFGLRKRISRGNGSLTEAKNRKLECFREGIRVYLASSLRSNESRSFARLQSN